MPPITLEFAYQEEIHTVQFNEDNGFPFYNPAIRREPGLYVIRNLLNQTWPVYVGTASNVRNRFDSRLEPLSHWGFVDDPLAGIAIYIVKVKVNGSNNATGPGIGVGVPDGWVAGVDAERLLIRNYIKKAQWNVRNQQKINPFLNRPRANNGHNDNNGTIRWFLTGNVDWHPPGTNTTASGNPFTLNLNSEL